MSATLAFNGLMERNAVQNPTLNVYGNIQTLDV